MITAARWISLIAAFFWGAVAEYHLGTAVGADQYTAALLPMVIDVYGFAAMKSARTLHIVGALVTMFGTQMAAHLLAMGGATKVMTALSIVVSAIPPSISLACHRLGVHDAVDAPADTVDAPPTVTVDAPAVTVEAPVTPALPPVVAALDAVDASVSVNDTIPDIPMTKADFAAQGAALLAKGHTKTSAAEVLGISRQWLHSCMKDAVTA